MLIDFENRLIQFLEIANAGQDQFALQQAGEEDSEEINIIAGVMNESQETNPIERGVAAILAFHNVMARWKLRAMKK